MKIELDNLSLRFGDGDYLLHDVSLAVEQGDYVIVNGPSGSGKSSLLRLLNRLQDPSSGRLLVDGCTVVDRDVTSLRRRFGFVQQTPVMVSGNVRTNLLLPFSYGIAAGSPPPADELLRERMGAFLLAIDLDDDAQPLSVGERQRLSLIRALLTNPQVMLCDEPTSALDPESRALVEARLADLCVSEGKTIVLVTHHDTEADAPTTRRLRLGEGRLLEVTE